MKVVDVHVHLFPEDVVDSYMDNYKDRTRITVYDRPTPEYANKQYEAIDYVDEYKYVILMEWESTIPFESKNLEYMSESDKYYTKCYFYSYHRWLSKVQRENEHILCFGGVHPDDPNMMEQFEKMVKEDKLSGLKLVPCMQHFYLNDKRLFPIYEQAEALDLPVLLHTGGDPVPGTEIFGHPRDVDDIASSFPNLKIITGHMGIPFFDETRELLKKHKNVFTDTAITIDFEEVRSLIRNNERDALTSDFFLPLRTFTRDILRQMMSALIKDLGYERVLFGSDFPFGNPRSAIESLMELDISDEGKEMILWKNAKEVLGLDI